MPFGIQPIHIVLIIIAALLIFGPKRLPEVGRWVGRSITEFRKGSQEMTNALREGMNEAQQVDDQKKTIGKPAPAQSVPLGDSKFCIKCGTANPQEALFCNKCGNPFPTQS
ncbi:MAG TPA: twin-arginine translocase TatA/TatE family subunit [Anaerolineales bacterium]|nr:twin-arginine translocase TatA/TatE family subunit [Anaerolineales bacterium]